MAIGQSAARGGVRRLDRAVAAVLDAARGNRPLGLAHPLPGRLPDRAVPVLYPPLAGGDRGVSFASAAELWRNLSVDARAWPYCAGRRRPGDDDHRVVLSDHCLYTDLRQRSAEAVDLRRVRGDAVRGCVQFHLAADHGGTLRPDRPQALAAGLYLAGHAYRLPRAALAGRPARLRPAAQRRAMAVLYLCQLQRSPGGDPDRDHACPGPYHRLFAGL